MLCASEALSFPPHALHLLLFFVYNKSYQHNRTARHKRVATAKCERRCDLVTFSAVNMLGDKIAYYSGSRMVKRYRHAYRIPHDVKNVGGRLGSIIPYFIFSSTPQQKKPPSAPPKALLKPYLLVHSQKKGGRASSEIFFSLLLWSSSPSSPCSLRTMMHDLHYITTTTKHKTQLYTQNTVKPHPK